MSRFSIGCVATGWTLAAQLAWAGPHPVTLGSQVGPAVVRQASGDANSDDSRKELKALLAQTRQAIKEGKWDEAESRLAEAEAMKVDLGLFHVGDTPKKLRRDLDSARRGPEKRLGFGKAEAPSDPFAARAAAESAPAVAGPRYNEMSARTKNVSNPADKAESDKLLLAARRALAVGDTRRAKELLSQTKPLAVDYEFHEDTPAKVEAAVNKYTELMQRPEQARGTESYKHQYAAALLEQSEALMNWGDLNDAQRLAMDAQRLPVNYSPFEARPESMLARIAEARKSGKRPEPLPPVGDEGTGPLVAGSNSSKAQTLDLLSKAHDAMATGEFDRAQRLIAQAESLGVADQEFGDRDDRPWQVQRQLDRLRKSGQAGVMQASGETVGSVDSIPGAAQAVYDPQNDSTGNIPASNAEELPVGGRYRNEDGAPVRRVAGQESSDGMTLYTQGEEALRAGDREAAMDLFRQAYTRRDELDPTTAQRLQDQLQLLTQNSAARQRPDSLIDQAAAEQQMLYRKISADWSRQAEAARDIQQSDPKRALESLQTARQQVIDSPLDSTSKEMLLRRADRDLAEVKQYLSTNQPQIELAERNDAVRKEIDTEMRTKVQVEEKLALLVDEFNKLMEERRFAEAEVVAKRARELAPNEPVVTQISNQSKFVANFINNNDVKLAKEAGFMTSLANVDKSAVPFDDNDPYQFGSPTEWADLTKRRGQMMAEQRRGNRSEKEMEIEQRLKTPVSLKFHEAPLSEVMDHLAKLAQVNLHLDPRGLAEEGVTTDTPVTIDLSQEISLKSALRLILEPLHLSHVVKDEVLKITSETMRDNELITITYSVADLVIPIPNFQPNANMGLTGALSNAYNQVGYGAGGRGGYGANTPMAVVANSSGGDSSAVIDPSVIAQMNTGMGGSSGGGAPQPLGMGPGGLGGGPQADFDSLIELITTTIEPTTWDEVGGPGAISPFEPNLSLVISQTQEIHENIVDLLDQLRRLQDLQVTIEVRFITLNDNFFERIGVDFDFDINDDTDRPFQIFGRPTTGTTTNNGGANGGANNGGNTVTRDAQDRDLTSSNSVTVGLQGETGTTGPLFNADLDIPFRQGSFGLAVPQFGGFDQAAGATLGFAILSDIEAFLFINAAQGDRRTNVLQAPKVTLFNGQQAVVSDTSQSPFVVSVIPVVGDFAAAQQPVIVVLNEGTFLTVQAVISSDRRFVRLTVVPFFSTIRDVDTFTFTGSESSTEETSSSGPDDDTDSRDTKKTVQREGTTVQLPTFSFVTVTTTVSVPDGGTVLLGGIKRLSEGRNEFGVPILSKIPYLNRLFKNASIGRETQSLMMMVTPRIIIQEEEEELILGQPSTN